MIPSEISLSDAEEALKPAPTHDERLAIAAKHGLSERTLRRYEAEGVNLWDDEEVAAKKASAPAGTEEVKELRAAKLRADTRHKQAQAERAELLLAQTKGELISIPAIAETYLTTASAVKAQLLRLEGELPGTLEGLSAADMVPVIHAKVELILASLSQELGG